MVNSWTLMVEMHFGINFIDPEKSYGVEIRWADEKMPFPETVKSLYI